MHRQQSNLRQPAHADSRRPHRTQTWCINTPDNAGTAAQQCTKCERRTASRKHKRPTPHPAHIIPAASSRLAALYEAAHARQVCDGQLNALVVAAFDPQRLRRTLRSCMQCAACADVHHLVLGALSACGSGLKAPAQLGACSRKALLPCFCLTCLMCLR